MKKLFFISLTSISTIAAQETHHLRVSSSKGVAGLTQTSPHINIVFNDFAERPVSSGSELEEKVELYGIHMLVRQNQIIIMPKTVDSDDRNSVFFNGGASGDEKFDYLRKQGQVLNQHASLIHSAALAKLTCQQLLSRAESIEQSYLMQQQTIKMLPTLKNEGLAKILAYLKLLRAKPMTVQECEALQKPFQDAAVDLVKTHEKPLEEFLFKIGFLEKPKS